MHRYYVVAGSRRTNVYANLEFFGQLESLNGRNPSLQNKWIIDAVGDSAILHNHTTSCGRVCLSVTGKRPSTSINHRINVNETEPENYGLETLLRNALIIEKKLDQSHVTRTCLGYGKIPFPRRFSGS